MPLPSGPVPGFSRTIGLQSGPSLQKLADLIGSVQPQITAKAGGGKSSAVQLNAAFCELSVVATAADSAKLPPGYAGLEIIVANNGAASAQIFGSGTDTINAVATGTGVAQANGVTALYKCVRVTNGVGIWYRILSA